jgi:LytS/YehU family sensor histidine kinase
MIKLLLEIYRHFQKQKSILRYNKQLAKTQAHSNLPSGFIFGTLELIQQNIHDNNNANQAIDKLSKLLNFAFYKSQHKTVTLQEEIEFLESYIGFERMRHSTNRVSIQFEHSITENSTIPPLLFINFIENAFKHGINSTIQQSWVKIFLHEENGILLFKAQNSLPKNAIKEAGGIGLKNVRRRLELEFPDKFVLNSMKSDIFEIDLVIQLR